jgi:hypothetical protein
LSQKKNNSLFMARSHWKSDNDSHTFCFKSGFFTYFFYTDRLLQIKQQLFVLAYTL